MGYNYPNDPNIIDLHATEQQADGTFLLVLPSGAWAKLTVPQIKNYLEGMYWQVGDIKMSVHNAQSNWVICEGGTILRSTKLGTYLVESDYPFGSGNGSTTVDLPDWRLHSPNGVYPPNEWEIGSQYDSFVANVPLLKHLHYYSEWDHEVVRVLESGGIEKDVMVHQVDPGVFSTSETGDDPAELNTFHPVFAIYYLMYAGEDVEVS
jgi:hypothetical protein